MKKLFLYILCLGWVMGGCDREPNGPEPEDPSPVFEIVDVPSKWALRSDRPRTVAAKVYDPQGVEDLSAVWVNIMELGTNGVTWADTLLDDANIDSTSGDLVPKDGIFSKLMKSDDFAPFEGQYIFLFQALDISSNLGEHLDTVWVGENSPPVVYNPDIPDTLLSGFAVAQFSIQVSDSQGQGDIKDVCFTIGGSVFYLLPSTQPFHYYLAVDSSFSAGLKGDYQIVFRATDYFEETNEPVIDSLWIENLSPRLGQITAPDTMVRGSGDTFVLEVVVSDPQGLGDIREVRFRVIKPDGSQGFSDDLHDDETHEDRDAGDGVFSQGISAPDPENLEGDYTFIFWAEDRVGNISPEDSVIVVVE
ncbi:hypothetical protein ISS37_02240 [candidate division KSB1 bacterium]|nr:hypothetical protein [candidate division KSB1 bacterium]